MTATRHGYQWLPKAAPRKEFIVDTINGTAPGGRRDEEIKQNRLVKKRNMTKARLTGGGCVEFLLFSVSAEWID